MSKNKSLTKAIEGAVQDSFDLDKFMESKNLTSTPIKMKDEKWIPLSEAFRECTSIPGIPMGHITLLRGHSDTGKTTALLEAAIAAQSMGILPVFIITEMKWSWDHAIMMGLKVQEIANEDGEIVNYKGNFIYVDREKLNTIEDVASFIADLIDEQKNGRLPCDLLFLWDSVGSVPCRLSVESNKNNNEWNAGAMSQQFGNFINQKIVLSRKQSQKYTNTLVAVNKIWVRKPENVMGQPKMANKAGNTMYSDASLVITFGNVSTSGTQKIKATKKGKDVEFAKRTKISVDKNHINGATSVGKVLATSHGFVIDDKKHLDEYKKQHSNEWLRILQTDDFDIVEEEEDSNDYFNSSESDD